MRRDRVQTFVAAFLFGVIGAVLSAPFLAAKPMHQNFDLLWPIVGFIAWFLMALLVFHEGRGTWNKMAFWSLFSGGIAFAISPLAAKNGSDRQLVVFVLAGMCVGAVLQRFATNGRLQKTLVVSAASLYILFTLTLFSVRELKKADQKDKVAVLKEQTDDEQREKDQVAAQAANQREQRITDFVSHVTYQPPKRDYPEARLLKKGFTCSSVIKALGNPDNKTGDSNGYTLDYNEMHFDCFSSGELWHIKVGNSEPTESIMYTQWYGPTLHPFSVPKVNP